MMPSPEDVQKQLEELEAATQQGDSSWLESMFQPYVQAAKDFNIGLADLLGLPGLAAEGLRSVFGYEEGSALPTSREVQQAMADVGVTYEPGEQPEALLDRLLRNLGASSIPIAGIAGKTGRLAAPLLTEFAAAGGGAAGGKALQQTNWGQQHPDMARAFGELAGGLSAGSPRAAKGLLKRGPPLLGLLKAPMRGTKARRRAARMLAEHAEDPSAALRGIRYGQQTLEEQQALTGSQMTGDVGLAKLRKKIEADIPEEAVAGSEQEVAALRRLREYLNVGEGQGGMDTMYYLDNLLKRRAEDAKRALQSVRGVKDPKTYNIQARQIIEKTYDESKRAIDRMWQKISDTGEQVQPNNVIESYKSELRDITEGGDIKEIDSFIRQKLGRMGKKGRLSGGTLISTKKPTTTPKALHQFYSRLGRRVRELSEQGGNANKVRILNRMRQSILDDLAEHPAGKEYSAAITATREFHNKFTQGSLGKVLGFQRGQAAPESTTLDELLKSSGEQARENLDQLLRAAPDSQENVKNLLRSRFAMTAVDEDVGRVNAKAGRTFLKQHKSLLDAFPDLRRELADAVSKQKRVDQLRGVGQVDELSPLSKQKAAASLFLGKEDPNDAVRSIIQTGKRTGETREYFTNLYKQVARDGTGKAEKGLKNAIVGEMLNYARRNVKEPGSDQWLISGQRFLDRYEELRGSLSSVFSRNELNRIKRVGQSLKKLETAQRAGPGGKIVTDMPGQFMDVLAQYVGARTGAQFGRTTGGTIQMAQIGSGRMKQLLRSLTNDEARNLMIKATQDPKLMDDLLKDWEKMSARAQLGLVERMVATAKELTSKAAKEVGRSRQAPAAAVTPPVAGYGEKAEEREESLRKSINQQLENL